MDNITIFLKQFGAWHDGHTVFRNGTHGNGWLEKNAVVRNPKYLDQVTKFQAKQISQTYPEVDMIIGPVTGGALIASYVARHLGMEFGVINGKQEPIVFHEMNIPSKQEKIVVVEDIISSGTDMNRFIGFLQEQGTILLGISVWMNRTKPMISEVEVISLMKTPFELYDRVSCPLCIDGDAIKYNDIRE